MGYYDYPEFADNPLIHALRPDNVMLAILRLLKIQGAAAEASFVQRIEAKVKTAPEFVPVSPDEIRQRTAQACTQLAAARLIASDGEGRWTMTDRGRAVLADNPLGVDVSVLLTFPEYRAYIHSIDARKVPEDVRPRAFEDGLAAFAEGRPITANPFEPDTSDHLSWECGWCEARDEES